MENQNQFVRESPESSNIAKATYNPETRVLSIQFKQGGTFHYSDVNEDVWLAYKSATSVGKFFHAYVRDKYPYSKG